MSTCSCSSEVVAVVLVTVLLRHIKRRRVESPIRVKYLQRRAGKWGWGWGWVSKRGGQGDEGIERREG